MSGSLTDDQFDDLWWRWIDKTGEMVQSPSHNDYPQFGHKNRDLSQAFVVLITMLRDEFGYGKDDMNSVREKFIEKMCPLLPRHTAGNTKAWKKSTHEKWQAARYRVFYQGTQEKSVLTDVRVVEPEDRYAAVPDGGKLMNRPKIDPSIGFDTGDKAEEYDLLKELGIDDE